MKLKEIHKIASGRLKNAGQCKSCEYLVGYLDDVECVNDQIDKLPETTGKKSWSEKGCLCPFWQPLKQSWCDNHGLYFEKYGCISCEAEYWQEQDRLEKEGIIWE